MGRTKQYDRIDLLNRAVELFRRQGYNGTSTAELVAELGVNRKSMYAEFGSKQQLFEATLEHYSGNHLARVLVERVVNPTLGLAGLRTLAYIRQTPGCDHLEDTHTLDDLSSYDEIIVLAIRIVAEVLAAIRIEVRRLAFHAGRVGTPQRERNSA